MRRGFLVLKECDQTSCSIRIDFRFARKEGRRKKIILGLGDLAHPVINYNHTEKKKLLHNRAPHNNLHVCITPEKHL